MNWTVPPSAAQAFARSIEPDDAEVVLDGATGEVIVTDVDGEPAVIDSTIPPMVEATLEDLIHDLVLKDRRIADSEAYLETVKKCLKVSREEREALVRAIKARDRHGEQVQFFAPDPTEKPYEPETGDAGRAGRRQRP